MSFVDDGGEWASDDLHLQHGAELHGGDDGDAVDGFGRPMKVESGYNTGSTPTTVSIVGTLNAPCACTPVGSKRPKVHVWTG